ncbi:MAG TPA: maleylpyruvate isomerase family mycothiol-dependent enzyme [Actinomycetota bacterium]|nr:maleylpyruvate isomerase family mycothiol-dependent enzyme [Actinomycetota bacterium]
MPDIHALLDDLGGEHAALDAIVADLTTQAWKTATPAEGWDVQDQIGHLAFFDDEATLALSNPEGFQEKLQELARDVGAFMDRSVSRGRELEPAEVLEWWRSAREQMIAAARATDPRIRIPWYGPPMSPASFISARQMETWAHAQDVADALGIRREHNDRIRNVAHLCVLTRAHSYATRGFPILFEFHLPRPSRTHSAR